MENPDKTFDNINNALLLDFYGQLLTEKSLEVAQLHYNEDMSLSEISELLGISRQAVHDTLRRAAAAIAGYESKLNLADLFVRQKSAIAAALADLDSGDIEAARAKLLALTEII